MARLIHQHLYPSLPSTQPIDFTRWFVLLVQIAAVGGIGLFLALVIVNTVLGVGQPETNYP